MSRINFRGDLEKVAKRQLEYLSSVLEEMNVKSSDVDIQAVGKDGDNYMSNTRRVIIEENGKTINMIAKFASGHKMLRKLSHLKMLFYNEHVVYTEIMPKYEELQIEAGIPNCDMFRHAKCYGSLSEPPYEVILLEDLKVSQFEMLSRYEPMSNEAVKLALKNFAIWHSLSFVLKDREPETFKLLKNKLGEYFYAISGVEISKQYFSQLEETTISMLDDDKYRNACKNTVGDIFTFAFQCLKPEEDSKYSVLRQGDGWSNNMMFRKENNVAVECVLIDYQLVFECSPVYDVMYMMFNSTDHDQRSKHYYEFIDYYHQELDKSLKKFGLEAKSIYPREQLDSDLKRYGKYAFSLSLLLSSVVIKKPENASKVKEHLNSDALSPDAPIPDEMFELDPETVLVFKKRVEGLVDSFQQFGLM